MSFKNIPQPVRTFSIVEAEGLGELPSPTATPDHRGVGRYAKWLAPAAALLLLPVGGGVFWAYSSHQRRADEVTQAARSAVAKDVTDRAPSRAEAEPQKSVAVQPAPPPAAPAPAPAEPLHPPALLAAEAISTANDGVYAGPICFGATATLAAHCLPIKATLQQGRLSGQWPGVTPGVTMYLAGDVSSGGHVTIHVHGEKADGTQQAVIDFDGMLHDGVLDATGNFANGRTATLNWRRGGEGTKRPPRRRATRRTHPPPRRQCRRLLNLARRQSRRRRLRRLRRRRLPRRRSRHRSRLPTVATAAKSALARGGPISRTASRRRERSSKASSRGSGRASTATSPVA